MCVNMCMCVHVFVIYVRECVCVFLSLCVNMCMCAHVCAPLLYECVCTCVFVP